MFFSVIKEQSKKIFNTKNDSFISNFQRYSSVERFTFTINITEQTSYQDNQQVEKKNCVYLIDY